jgi:Methyltransferase domain
MSAQILPKNTYNPLVGYQKRETFIDDTPQEFAAPLMSSRTDEFDDLYDISEGEEDLTDIPISISISNSPVVTRKDKSYPTLAIPDLSSWPSHTSKKHVEPQPFNSSHLSPRLVVPTVELARIQRGSAASSSSRTPSLDGSLTSDELNGISCPSTPDISNVVERPEDWTLPAQLNPTSLRTLGCLSVPKTPMSQLFALQPLEMTEKGADLHRLNTDVEIAMTPIEAGELSALSIPSPGGFFSSLDASSRNAWLPEPQQEGISSTIAENFYGCPFDSPQRDSRAAPTPTQQSEFIVEDNNFTDGPPTARQQPAHWNCGTPGLQAFKSPSFPPEPVEYNDTYVRQLQAQSAANLDRTSSWLASQSYAAPEEHVSGADAFADKPLPPIKADDLDDSDFPAVPEYHEEQDETFIRGFEYLQNSQQPADTFVHRKTRTEKLRLDRKCLFNTHVSQLEGKYNLASPPQVKSAMRAPELDTVTEEEVTEKLAIATALREQDALEQIQTASWAIEATKYLNGGTLLTSPVRHIFGQQKDIRILDLGGVASCDWAWQVALENPDSTVHTVCLPDSTFDTSIAAPKNHKQYIVDNLWTLPFPPGYFDAVSARNLHALLKLKRPSRRGGDEYDLTLRECMRVLRPGGYIEFALLDSDIVSPGHLGQVMNDEFRYNLKKNGYDAAPTKGFLARVRKAGFGQIRRAWLVLPMSQYAGNNGVEGTTADASYIAGMVGAWAWERWLLKVQREMGKEEGQLLQGVADIMEEGAKAGAGWRYLSGWARKPY